MQLLSIGQHAIVLSSVLFLVFLALIACLVDFLCCLVCFRCCSILFFACPVDLICPCSFVPYFSLLSYLSFSLLSHFSSVLARLLFLFLCSVAFHLFLLGCFSSFLTRLLFHTFPRTMPPKTPYPLDSEHYDEVQGLRESSYALNRTFIRYEDLRYVCIVTPLLLVVANTISPELRSRSRNMEHSWPTGALTKPT